MDTPDGSEPQQRLDAAEAEIAALKKQVETLTAARDETRSQLSLLQQAFRTLELRLRRFETALLKTRRAGTPGPEAAIPAPSAFERDAPSGAPGPSGAPARRAAYPLVLVHIEDDPKLREALRAVAARLSLGYCVLSDGETARPAGPRLPVLNLWCSQSPRLAALTDDSRPGPDYAVLTYCTDGSRGRWLGPLRCFPPPFDSDLCLTRLFAGSTTPQRLLVVTEDLETARRITAAGSDRGCVVAQAFDARQAIELAPLARPDTILIDLALPRGDAFRVITGLRSEANLARIPLSLFWTNALAGLTLQEEASRETCDLPFSAVELERAAGEAVASGLADNTF